MKKIVPIVSCLILISGLTVSAAPLQDYSKGKVKIDVHGANSKLKVASSSCSTDTVNYNRKYTFGYSATEGLGNNFAVQYKNQRIDANRQYGAYSLFTKGNAEELNLLYKLNDNFSAIAGANRISGKMDINGNGATGIKGKTNMHVGILGTAKLSEGLTGWALAAGGKNNRTYEIGLGHELSEDAELNLFYRYKDYSKLQTEVGDCNITSKISGYGLGITMKL